jgi:hypothetical protein
MAFCKDICCKKFIDELQCGECFSLLLYTVDGFVYYGRIEKIFDNEIALLVPGAGQNQVLIRHPDQTFCPQGCSCIFEDFTLIDLCKVVAKTAPLSCLPPGLIVDNIC